MGGMIGLLWEDIWTPYLDSVGDSWGATVIFNFFSPNWMYVRASYLFWGEAVGFCSVVLMI